MRRDELKIIVWNVNKLRRHSNNPDFKQLCLSHDIVCLIETWAKDKDDYSTLFETHHPSSSVRSAENHFSGGIIAYVRNELLPGCVRIYENFDDLAVLKLDKEFFSPERDLIFVAVYLSPEASTVFNTYEKARFEHIEEKISQIVEEYDNIDIMLAGDFNARTGELDDFIMTDSTEFVPELCDNPSYDTDDFNMPRENVDKQIDNYGRDLISFCQSYGMHIVNRRVTGDERGNITCVANGGQSVVDYILVNTRFYNRISHLEVCVRTESDHFPLLCKLGCALQNNHVFLAKDAKKAKESPKSGIYKWSSKVMKNFRESLMTATQRISWMKYQSWYPGR